MANENSNNHKHQHHDHQNEVISIVCRSIKPGYEKDYDEWLRRYLNLKEMLKVIWEQQ